MRLGIDVDDVVFPSNELLIRWHNEQYGSRLTPNDRTSYYLEHVWGGTHDDVVRKVGEFYDSVPLLDIEPLPGAREVLWTLRAQHELVAVTARFRRHKELTERYFTRHFPGYFSDIVVTCYGEAHAVPKSRMCVKLGIHRLIDDHLDHAIECVDLGVAAVVFGEYPWNQGNGPLLNIDRVKDWNGVLTLSHSW